LEALGRTVSLMNSLTYLNLSDNKFDVEASQMLGTFLLCTKALQTLEIAGTAPVFSKVVESMSGNGALQPCTLLKKLDVSRNPVEKKKKGETDDPFARFLMGLPEVVDINISGTNVSAEAIVDLITFNRRLSHVDISDNDLTDDGIALLMKQMSTSHGQCAISTLKMNRVFHRRTATRPAAMAAIAKTLNSIVIEEFEIQGDKKSGKVLKGDLLDVALALLGNKTLTKLDVSGNQAGDDLGIALGKIFQHNNTLNTLVWDNNEVGIVGFKAVKLGLERNLTMQYLETPVDDIFFLKDKTTNPEILGALIKDIQKVVIEISKNKFEQQQEDEKKTKPKKAETSTTIRTTKQKKERKKQAPLEYVDMRRASVAFLHKPKDTPADVTRAEPSQ